MEEQRRSNTIYQGSGGQSQIQYSTLKPLKTQAFSETPDFKKRCKDCQIEIDPLNSGTCKNCKSAYVCLKHLLDRTVCHICNSTEWLVSHQADQREEVNRSKVFQDVNLASSTVEQEQQQKPIYEENQKEDLNGHDQNWMPNDRGEPREGDDVRGDQDFQDRNFNQCDNCFRELRQPQEGEDPRNIWLDHVLYYCNQTQRILTIDRNSDNFELLIRNLKEKIRQCSNLQSDLQEKQNEEKKLYMTKKYHQHVYSSIKRFLPFLIMLMIGLFCTTNEQIQHRASHLIDHFSGRQSRHIDVSLDNGKVLFDALGHLQQSPQVRGPVKTFEKVQHFYNEFDQYKVQEGYNDFSHYSNEGLIAEIKKNLEKDKHEIIKHLKNLKDDKKKFNEEAKIKALEDLIKNASLYLSLEQ